MYLEAWTRCSWHTNLIVNMPAKINGLILKNPCMVKILQPWYINIFNPSSFCNVYRSGMVTTTPWMILELVELEDRYGPPLSISTKKVPVAFYLVSQRRCNDVRVSKTRDQIIKMVLFLLKNYLAFGIFAFCWKYADLKFSPSAILKDVLCLIWKKISFVTFTGSFKCIAAIFLD